MSASGSMTLVDEAILSEDYQTGVLFNNCSKPDYLGCHVTKARNYLSFFLCHLRRYALPVKYNC